jgi:hypothetical protein
MPNWCNNYLELQHDDPEMITRARKAFNEGKLLEEFCPVPASLHVVAGRVGNDEDPEQKKLEEQTEQNIKEHGYGNWYDYCVNEWGTKWDVGGDGYEASDDGPNSTTMVFDSAWAPPTGAMDKFMDLGFRVTLYYYESGMCFAGIYDANGDNYFDFSDMTADEVDAEIPDELDIKFSIVETMREWEEENSEDEENIDIDLDGGLGAVNEQEHNENK